MEYTEKEWIPIGELAKMVGVTVRTLQYYDRENLLKSEITPGGRRVYSQKDVLKLQQILFFKSLGFSLHDIKNQILKQESAADLQRVFRGQRDVLLRQINQLSRIVEILNLVIEEAEQGKSVSMDRLLTILKLMQEGNPYTFIVRYFDDSQFKSLEDRFGAPEIYDEFMRYSGEVFEKMNVLYQKGEDPASRESQEMAKQWWNMVGKFTQGDTDLLKALVSSGKDIDNWPEEARKVQEPIKNFLSKALNIYFLSNGIRVEE